VKTNLGEDKSYTIVQKTLCEQDGEMFGSNTEDDKSQETLARFQREGNPARLHCSCISHCQLSKESFISVDVICTAETFCSQTQHACDCSKTSIDRACMPGHTEWCVTIDYSCERDADCSEQLTC